MISLLIVDDEPEILDELFDIIFSQYPDLRMMKTSIAREAKEILETDVIDILLTDIKMPRIDGFELSKVAKSCNGICRIVYLTGYNDFQYAYNAIKIGCDDFILKTNTKQEILNAIGRVMQSIEYDRVERELLLEAERLKQLSKPLQKKELNSLEYIKAYIWDNLDKLISLNDLSKMVFLSPAYLSRIFKNTTGVTITEYLVHARMEKAKKFLLESNIKVQEVAKKVGIDSPVYFGRLFKKEIGLTPQEYRQNKLFASLCKEDKRSSE